jgi:hypothetical protein
MKPSSIFRRIYANSQGQGYQHLEPLLLALDFVVFNITNIASNPRVDFLESNSPGHIDLTGATAKGMLMLENPQSRLLFATEDCNCFEVSRYQAFPEA